MSTASSGSSAPSPVQRTGILVLGPSGSGKTSLLRQLRHMAKNKGRAQAGGFATTASVGMELCDLMWNKKHIYLRELGGAMAAVWPRYLATAQALVYLLDASSLVRLADAQTGLLTLLQHSALKGVPVLLVLNKVDDGDVAADPDDTPALVKDILRVDDLVATAPQPMTYLVASACSGYRLDAVLTWLAAHAPASP